MLEPLIRTAAAVGLSLDVTSSKALAESLDRAVVGSSSFAKLHLFTCIAKCVYASFCLSDA